MKRFSVLFLFLIFVSAAVFAQSDLQPVATVRLTRNEPITVRMLKTELEKLIWQNLVPSLRRVPTTAEVTRVASAYGAEEKKQILDVMINERLALQAAERDRITVTDNELNQQINWRKEQMAQEMGRQPSDAEFAAAVKNETGQDFPAFREELRRQAIVQKYLRAKKESYFNIQQPTGAEIDNAFNNSRATFVRPDTVRFSIIQVPYGPDAASRARARDLAGRLTREIGTDPAKFDEAVMKGQIPNSGYQAGDGTYLPRTMQAQQAMGVDFINTAFSLKQGQVSKLIEGVQGFQIIKVTETYALKILELDDIIFQPGNRMAVRQYIVNSLLQQKSVEAAAKATQELVTELRAGNSFQIMERNLNW